MAEIKAQKAQSRIQDPTHYAKRMSSKDIYIPKGLRGKYHAVPTNEGVQLKKIEGQKLG